MTVSFNENYFQLFEIEKSVLIDLNVLEDKYLELQKEFHPDKYVNASDQEKRISLQITSYINEAYNTLKNDYSSTLLQEGTFNTFGKDFTIFVKNLARVFQFFKLDCFFLVPIPPKVDRVSMKSQSFMK